MEIAVLIILHVAFDFRKTFSCIYLGEKKNRTTKHLIIKGLDPRGSQSRRHA